MTSLWTSLINHRDIRAGGSNRAVTNQQKHKLSLTFGDRIFEDDSHLTIK